MNITMASVYNNFKGEYTGGTEIKRIEPDKIEKDSTIILADTVILKLRPNLEDVNEFGLNNDDVANVWDSHTHTAPGMIPYIHLDPSPTAICFTWKMPESCSFETYIFIEKKPASKDQDTQSFRFIDHLPADAIFQYLFTNLSPGKTFKFRIKAFNSVGEGPFSRWVETSTLHWTPEPPELKCLEWNTDSLKLSWGDLRQENILYYVVEMQTKMRIFKKIFESPKLNFKLTMLRADTAYHFRICAFDESGQGPYSAPHTFSTSFRISPCIRDVKAIDVLEYYQQVFTCSELVPSELLSKVDMRHSYKYESKDAIKNPEKMPVPSAINKIHIYSMIGSFYLSWAEPIFNSSTITSYNIQIDSCLVNTEERIQQILLVNLSQGTTYNIRIQAVNHLGAGLFSEMLQVTTLYGIPQPPELKCKILGLTYMELGWDVENRNGVLSYTVELQGKYGFYTVYQGLNHSCLLDTLEPNTRYYFRTWAFCSGGRSEYSKSYCFRTLSAPYQPKITEEEDEPYYEKCKVIDEEVETPEFIRKFLKFKFTYKPPPEKFGMEVTAHDFCSLHAGTYLNDTIIEFYLKYLYCERLSETEREKTHIFSTFFFSKLSVYTQCPEDFPQEEFNKRRHDSVKTWTRKIDLFAKDFIILPINKSLHWIVAIICYPGLVPEVSDSGTLQYSNHNDENSASSWSDSSQNFTEDSSDESEFSVCDSDCSTCSMEKKQKRKTPCICIFDSYLSYSLENTKDYFCYPTIIRQYLESEWNVRKGTKKIFNEYTMPSHIALCPQQPNSFDCGIFMLQCVETFFENPFPYFQGFYCKLENCFTLEAALRKRHEIKKLILELNEKYGTIPVSIARDWFYINM